MKQLQLWNSTSAYNVSEVQLSYKCEGVSTRPQVKTSTDGFNILNNNWNPDSIGHLEEMKVLLLNRANRVLGLYSLSKGGITGTVVDIRILMQSAILTNATSIILAHNHPSGGTQPSEADRTLTRQVKEACKILEIGLLDHIILTPEGNYFSFGDEGFI